MTHDVFTGSAGADRCSAGGWSHTVPDELPVMGGRPERFVAARAREDRWHPWVWFLATLASLCVLAVLTKPVLWLALWLLGLLP